MKAINYLIWEHSFINEFKRIAHEYHLPLFLIRIDCLLCKIFHSSSPAQYVAFQFYKLRGRERAKFVTAGKSVKIEKVFNNAPKSEKDQIGKKHFFNKTFAHLIQRDWVFIPETTEEELSAFIARHDKILVKPDELTQGEGIHLLSQEELKDGVHAFFLKATSERLLLEAFIKQHPVLNAVNPSSVNTLRVCSVRDTQGEVHIIGASLRAGGAGSVVDNLHANGVQYSVDPENGIIIRGGVSHSGERDIYYHPSTQYKMIGLQIPNWDIVVNSVKEAGKILPNLRYIGWDIAVTEDGCEFIEANYGQGSNGMQQDGVGKYRIIMKYV